MIVIGSVISRRSGSWEQWLNGSDRIGNLKEDVALGSGGLVLGTPNITLSQFIWNRLLAIKTC